MKPTKIGLGPIKTREVLATTDVAVASELNSYSVSVFTRVEDGFVIPEPVVTYAGPRTLTEVVCTLDDVMVKLDKLEPNKSACPDGFLPSVMKKMKTGLAVHLHHLFTASLESGEVPDDLLIADVTPIFKAGERTECSNYRPISLRSILGKLLESIIGDRISAILKRMSS